MTREQHAASCGGEIEPKYHDAESVFCDTCGYDTQFPSNWNTEDYGPEPDPVK